MWRVTQFEHHSPRITLHEKSVQIVLLHVFLSDLCIRVYFGIFNKLEDDMLLRKSSIDYFVRNLFPAVRKPTPSNSHSVAISPFAAHKKINKARTAHSEKSGIDYDVEIIHLVRAARQTRLKLHSQRCVLVTATTSDVTTA